MVSPRRALLAAGAAVALVAAAGCSSGASNAAGAAGTLVVSTFPFGVDQFTEAVVDPFTKATGIKVEVETGSNSDRLSQLQAAGGKAAPDVVLMSDYYAALGQQTNLFQKVPADKVPNLAKIASFAKEDAYNGPAYSYQLNGTVYDTEKLGAADAAKWDVYAGAHAKKVALPDISVTAGQLMVSGVAATYGSGPYDIDAALKTLGGWGPGILQFYSSSTEVTNLITQGEIVAADALNGFATSLVGPGKKIAWTPPATGRFMATNRAMIPTDAKNLENAYKFIDFLLSAEVQTRSSELVGDLPVNPGATVPAALTAVVGDIAKDPVAAGYTTLDPAKLVPTRKDWVNRFAREVTGK